MEPIPPRFYEAAKVRIPTAISPAAREKLAAGLAGMPAASEATASVDWSDPVSVRAHIDGFEAFLDPHIDNMLARAPATVTSENIGGLTIAVATPHDLRHPDRAVLKYHGGGFVLLGGRFFLADAAVFAAAFGCRVYSVDYRMAPEHLFPAALEDCVSAYREVLKRHDPRKVALAGASSGATLAASAVLRARDEGLPLPGAMGLLSPIMDLNCAGDTWETNFGYDFMIPDYIGNGGTNLWIDGHDRYDPDISPLFGDFRKGFPPTFIQSGTRDRLLSDAVRLHRALLNADVATELHVWEAMPHGGFGGGPEDQEVRSYFCRFMDKHLIA